MKPSIGTTTEGRDLRIDVPRLLATRMLLQADSGGGKTWVLKRILEQTHAHVQQIVLDPEGEFSTLRERFDYLLCAPEGADAIASPKTAAILARKLRETRVSTVIDIYDLRPQEQKHFVRVFIEELLAAPKSLWNPCLLIIDEAQVFAPEGDKAESLGAIMDLRGRGRKRGLCPILATPRLAQLSKDAAAGMQNKLIGVTMLDLDVNRAARDLSLSAKEATPLLRNLEPGEFYCFGPALTRAITKVRVGAIQTPHGQHTAGKDARTPEPSDKIKTVIAKLTDLPKEAEQEARTSADLRRENAQLRRELTAAKRAQPAPAPTKIERIEVPTVGKKAIAGIEKAARDIGKAVRRAREAQDGLAEALKTTDGRITDLLATLAKVHEAQNRQVSQTKPPPHQDVSRSVSTKTPEWRKYDDAREARPGQTTSAEINGPMQRILDAIAWFESLGITEPNLGAVAFLAGYTPTGGGFNNPRGALRVAGLIEYRGDRLALTEAGRHHARFPDTVLTNEELQRRVLQRLPGPERKLLQELLEAWPVELADEELAERTGYTVGGGAFNNPKGRLRSLGLVTYPARKRVRAADILFPIPTATIA